MKYTKEERLDICRRIYNREIGRFKTAERYGIYEHTAQTYMKMYRDANQIPPVRGEQICTVSAVRNVPVGLEDVESMTKKELIQELVKARITEAR